MLSKYRKYSSTPMECSKETSDPGFEPPTSSFRSNRRNHQSNTCSNYLTKRKLLKNIEIIEKSKSYFKIKIEEYILNFKEKDFETIINELLVESKSKFDDYISHPKSKLRANDDEVNNALTQLGKEIEVIRDRHLKKIEIKLENLKANIIIEINKVNKLLFETKATLEQLYFSNGINKDKLVRVDDIVEPFALGFGGAGAGFGLLVGVAIGVGAGESIAGGIGFGALFGSLAAGVGVIVGIVGFGIYNLYKVTHKEEDLVELTQKSKKEFLDNVHNYCEKLKNSLEEYQSSVSSQIESIIENYIYELKKAMDEV